MIRRNRRAPILHCSTCLLRYLLYVLAICSILVVALLSVRYADTLARYRSYEELLDKYNSGSDKTPIGCDIPRLNPYDPSIQQYLTPNSGSIECKEVQPALTWLDADGSLHFNATVGLNVDCSYRCFRRNEGVDDQTLSYGEWTKWDNLNEPTKRIKCEFISVSCSQTSFPPVEIYSQIFAQIIPEHAQTENRPKPFSPSVLIFVLDSVSRSNFIRQLPLTRQVLEDDYKIFEFEGFSKVGDNSLPNAAAFLTGKRVCIAGVPDDLPCDMTNDFFDDWPLIWKDYAAAGYRTFYAEDYPDFNLFYYLSNGFKHKPTTHYLRPYWVSVWPSFVHRRSSHLCYNNAPKHRRPRGNIFPAPVPGGQLPGESMGPGQACSAPTSTNTKQKQHENKRKKSHPYIYY